MSPDRDDADFHGVTPPRDPYSPSSDGAVAYARIGTFAYCLASGLGIGVFFEAPLPGALAGGFCGVLAGLWLAPALFREWRD